MASYDICVFGGGPSGSAIALRLAQFGYSVVIVEKEVFPRHQVGISMSPGIQHWLYVLGVKEQVEQEGFIPATRSVLLWEDDLPIRKDSAGGFHADRGRFDQILLNAAVAAGAVLIQPCNQISVEDTSGEWKIILVQNSSAVSITAKFIVEATGRKSILKGAKTSHLPATLATYAYWNVQSDNTSFIEAGENHWYWGAPAAPGKFMACVFSDPKDIKSYASVKDYYLARMRNFSLLYPQLQNKTLNNVSVCSATAYADQEPVSCNYIKVGDAAFSTVPLSAQGVQKAIKTAVQGAIVVNTILSNISNADMAINFYNEMIRTEVKKNTQWTNQHYNNQNRYKDGEFWQRRRSNSAAAFTEKTISIKKTGKLFINPNAVTVNVPVIAGTLIAKEKGIMIEGNDEPFVFIQDFPVAILIHALHDKELMEGLMIAKLLIPNSDPKQVLKWLLYNRILVNKAAAVTLY